MADETTTTTQTDPGATQTTQTTPSTTTTTAGAGQTGGTGGEKMLTQAEVDAVVKDRLERQQRAIDAKAKSDREAAEAQRLTEQQEFKTLAERHEAKVREIEPQLQAATTERDALRTHVNRQIDTAMKDWPAEIKGRRRWLPHARQRALPSPRGRPGRRPIQRDRDVHPVAHREFLEVTTHGRTDKSGFPEPRDR